MGGEGENLLSKREQTNRKMRKRGIEMSGKESDGVCVCFYEFKFEGPKGMVEFPKQNPMPSSPSSLSRINY